MAELTHNGKKTADILELCRVIAEASPIPMAEIDPRTKNIDCVNLAFCLLTGKSKQTLIGSSLSQVVPDAQECLSLIDQVQQTGTAISHTGPASGWSYVFRPLLVGESGTLALILQVSEAMTPGHEAVLVNQALLFGALRQHELIEAAELLNMQLRAEMVARKAAEKALIRSEKLAVAGRMAAVLAHEINNPLTAVMELLYLVRTSESVSPADLQYIEQADGELMRIAHITRQTLGFHRESSASTIFPVLPLLNSIVDLLRSRVRSTRASVEIQCKPDLMVAAIYSELRQVLSNFLLNSLEALGEEGRIRLRASPCRNPRTGANCIRFTLADNGNGIDPAILGSIFDAFYTTKGVIGNGLGLWVCKQIIANHHGTVQVRSNTGGPRRGTTISLTVPMNPEEEPTPATYSGVSDPFKVDSGDWMRK